MQSESTQLISGFTRREPPVEHEIKIIDGYILTPIGQAATVSHDHMATEVCVCVCPQEFRHTCNIYTHSFNSCLIIKKKTWKIIHYDWFECLGSGYPRRQSSIARSSCSSWHWGPKWRQRRRLTLEMTERAGPLAPLGQEKKKKTGRTVISINDDSLSHFRRPN